MSQKNCTCHSTSLLRPPLALLILKNPSNCISKKFLMLTSRVNLSYVDGEPIEGVTLETKRAGIPFEGPLTTDSFLMAITKGNSLVLSIPENREALLIDIETEAGGPTSAYSSGDHLKQQFSHAYRGHANGLDLRTAETGKVHHHRRRREQIQGGSLVRVDALRAGRDSTITSGTVSAGVRRLKPISDICWIPVPASCARLLLSAERCILIIT